MGNSASGIAKIEERYLAKQQEILDSAMTAQIQSNKELISSLEHVSEFLTPEMIDALAQLPNSTVVTLVKYYNDYVAECKEKVFDIADEIIKASRPMTEMTTPEILQSLSPQTRAETKTQIKQQNKELKQQKKQQKDIDVANAGNQAIAARQTVLSQLKQTVGQIRDDVRQNGDAVDLSLAASTIESAGQMARAAQQQASKAHKAGNKQQTQTAMKQAQVAADTAQQVVDTVAKVIPSSVVAPMASAAQKIQQSVQRQQADQQ